MSEVRTYDASFAVPFTHRLRFTRDVLGPDAAALKQVLESSHGAARVLCVVDEGLASAAVDVVRRLEEIAATSQSVEQAGDTCTVVGGEACKNDPASVDALLAAFNRANLDRHSYVVVAGGGAVLDCVGYAAAVAHRGLRLVRLPSTTLAQTDSGVGVKNAINWFGKKNWRGTFAVPWAVINDEALLDSLPDRDFRCGFSEAVKVSVLKDEHFFQRLCDDAPRIAARDAQATRFAIEHSAVWHLRHITQGGDPFETREARPLDFGHWSAHRLEAMTNFEIRHGEAVGMGLAIDSIYSSLLHGLSGSDAQRVIGCLRELRIPLNHPALHDADSLLDGLEEFRQHLGGRLTITMLAGIGQPLDVHEIDAIAMRDAIHHIIDLPLNAAAGVALDQTGDFGG